MAYRGGNRLLRLQKGVGWEESVLSDSSCSEEVREHPRRGTVRPDEGRMGRLGGRGRMWRGSRGRGIYA